jgi:hypothetical protein
MAVGSQDGEPLKKASLNETEAASYNSRRLRPFGYFLYD